MRRLTPLLLTLGSALLYAACFPPLEWHALAWVALVPWLHAIARVDSVAAAAGLGAIWGVAAGFGVSFWLPRMVAEFFAIDLAIAALWSLAVELSAGCYFALFAAALALAGRARVANPVVIAVAWSLCEWLRATWPIPNPWALFAYSQAVVPVVAQLAELGGPFGIGALLALVNGTLASALEPRLPARGRRRAWAALTACAVLAALAFGALRLAEARRAGTPLRVALIQGGIARANRFKPEVTAQNLAHYLALSRGVAAENPDLIVWPEFAIESPLRLDPVAQLALAEFSKTTRAALLVGGPDLRGDPADPRAFNSAFAIQGGRVIGQYDKVDLMPFSESNPLPRWLRGPGEQARYSAGQQRAPLAVGGVRVAVLLCSEAMHPARARDAVARGAQLIVNPSNDDWFGHPSAQRQQLLAIAMRAIETRRWVVRVAASGPSAVIDPNGSIEWVSASNVPVAVVREIRIDGGLAQP